MNTAVQSQNIEYRHVHTQTNTSLLKVNKPNIYSSVNSFSVGGEVNLFKLINSSVSERIPKKGGRGAF